MFLPDRNSLKPFIVSVCEKCVYRYLFFLVCFSRICFYIKECNSCHMIAMLIVEKNIEKSVI